jgi:micrococcal nuclease
MKLAALAVVTHIMAPGTPFEAQVVRVVDGDSVVVEVPAWAATPFETVAVRIAGIDTPESRKPPAKCVSEVKLGKAASAFAKTLAKPGDKVTLIYRGLDKYARIDGDLTLADGRNWATVMLTGGYATAYNGKTKQSWCAKKTP